MDMSRLDLFHRLAHSEKPNFLEFVNSIGKDGLQQIFKFPGEDFSLWWFSLVAEKSTLKSDVYAQLISLLLSRGKEVNKKTLKRIIKETFFYQFLTAMYALFYLYVRALYIKLSLKNFYFRKNKLHGHRYIIVSYFPFVNKSAAKKGVFENGYLNSFHKLLEEKYSNEYSHICIQLNLNGYNLNDSLKIARRFLKTQSLFYLEEFLKASHLFRIIFYYFYFSAIFFLNLNKIRKEAVYEYGDKTIDVWSLFKNDFYRSFCGVNLIFSIWYILLFKELTENLLPKTKIISIYENQTWEKALYIFARKIKSKTIGFQHAAVPELLLSYFNVRQEIGNNNFIKNCPLPDYVATVGRIPFELFTKYGWPKERVFIWGAQRFENLRDLDNSYIDRNKKKNYFVCAFSINTLEAHKLLFMLEEAFHGYLDYKVFLKSHPTMDLKKIVKKIKINLNPEIFVHTDADLSKIIPHAKGIIVTESSSSFFALACSIPIITPRFVGSLDYSPLSYVSDIPMYVYSPEQLLYVCNQIAAGQSGYDTHDKGRNFLKEYLHFPKDDYEYLEKIISL